MAYRLLHKKSSVKNRVPNVDVLEYGELAINYNAESPTLFIKDSKNEIQSFISKNEIGDLLHTKQNTPITISHADLLDLLDNNELIIGQKYRINDYVTTTSQIDTKSLGKPFDIIVTAISTNTLSECATAVQSDRDKGYFDNNKLESWEIKYCVTNDTSRFAWAGASDGKGVIYYMKDEFNNEAWYDFKNIQFLRTSQWFKDNPNFYVKFTEDKYFFTFSVVDGNGNITDDTLYSTNYHAINNSLGRNTNPITHLNNTIFIDLPNKGAFNNVIADGHSGNTFGQQVWNNTIGYNFIHNIINKQFQYNTIDAKCQENHFWGFFVYNVVESDCYSNRFTGNVTKCIFKQSYTLNNFTGETLSQCTFGMGNNWINDMPSMTNVTFSNNCVSGSNSVYLNNLYTVDGKKLLDVINNFNSNLEYSIMPCINDRYDIFSHNVINKVSNIYDMGMFDNSGDAEDAAKNPNIATNKNINLLKYYIPSINKTGIIEQLVGDNETTQIITWDGLRKQRILRFQNIGGNVSLINNPIWEGIKIVTTAEWNSLLNGGTTATTTIGIEINNSIYNADSQTGLINISDVINNLNKIINENERTVAEALNKLNDRIKDLEQNKPNFVPEMPDATVSENTIIVKNGTVQNNTLIVNGSIQNDSLILNGNN